MRQARGEIERSPGHGCKVWCFLLPRKSAMCRDPGFASSPDKNKPGVPMWITAWSVGCSQCATIYYVQIILILDMSENSENRSLGSKTCLIVLWTYGKILEWFQSWNLRALRSFSYYHRGGPRRNCNQLQATRDYTGIISSINFA